MVGWGEKMKGERKVSKRGNLVWFSEKVGRIDVLKKKHQESAVVTPKRLQKEKEEKNLTAYI